MINRLIIIGGFALVALPVYGLAMHSTPRKGLLLWVEKMCMGIVLCYLCQIILRPFGVPAAQGPFAALTSGWLGIPGAALATFLSLWP